MHFYKTQNSLSHTEHSPLHRTLSPTQNSFSTELSLSLIQNTRPHTELSPSHRTLYLSHRTLSPTQNSLSHRTLSLTQNSLISVTENSLPYTVYQNLKVISSLHYCTQKRQCINVCIIC